MANPGFNFSIFADSSPAIQSLNNLSSSFARLSGTSQISTGQIAMGFFQGQLAINALQWSVNALQGQLTSLYGKFQEGANIQDELLVSTNTFKSLTGSNFDQAEKAVTNLNLALADSAASLPGATNEYISLSNAVNDSVVEAFKNPQGKLDVKGWENATVELVSAYGALTASSTKSFGNTQLSLTKALTGGSVAELRNLQFFEQNPAVINEIENKLKELGKNSLKDVDIKTRLKIVTEAATKLVDDDFRKKSETTVSGLMAGFQTRLFDPMAGIFGIMRDLDKNIEGNQSVFSAMNDVLVTLIGSNGLFDSFVKFLGKLGFEFKGMENLREGFLSLNKGLKSFQKFIDSFTSISNSVEMARNLIDRVRDINIGQYVVSISNWLFERVGSFFSNLSVFFDKISETVTKSGGVDTKGFSSTFSKVITSFVKLVLPPFIDAIFSGIGAIGVIAIEIGKGLGTALLNFNWASFFSQGVSSFQGLSLGEMVGEFSSFFAGIWSLILVKIVFSAMMGGANAAIGSILSIFKFLLSAPFTFLVSSVTGSLGRLAGFLLPQLSILAQQFLGLSVTYLANALGLVVSGISTISTFLITRFIPAIITRFNSLLPILGGIAVPLSVAIAGLSLGFLAAGGQVSDVKALFNLGWDGFRAGFQGFVIEWSETIKLYKPILASNLLLLFANINLLLTKLRITFENYQTNIVSFFSYVFSGISSFIGMLVNIFTTYRDLITGIFSSLWNSVLSGILNTNLKIISFFDSITGTLSGLWNSVLSGIININLKIISFFDSITGTLSDLWNSFLSGILNINNNVLGFLNLITETFGNFKNNVQNRFQTIINSVLEVFNWIGNKVQGFMTQLQSLNPFNRQSPSTSRTTSPSPSPSPVPDAQNSPSSSIFKSIGDLLPDIGMNLLTSGNNVFGGLINNPSPTVPGENSLFNGLNLPSLSAPISQPSTQTPIIQPGTGVVNNSSATNSKSLSIGNVNVSIPSTVLDPETQANLILQHLDNLFESELASLPV